MVVLEEGMTFPLQYSCLENPHGEKSLWGYNPCGRKESDTTEQLVVLKYMFNFQQLAIVLDLNFVNKLMYFVGQKYFQV